MGKRTAEFVISATDNTKGGIASVQSGLKALTGSFGKLGGIATGALAAIGVGFTIHGLVDMVQHANELTDAMNDTSNRIGVGVTALQAWEAWAKKSGISVEELTGLLTKLDKNIGLVKLNESSKETVAAFDRVGLSVQQVKAGKPDEIAEKIIDGLGKIGDPAVKAATAMQLFGKQGATALTLVADGTDGLHETEKMLRETGLALTAIDASKVGKANDILDDLGTIAQSAKQKLGAELAPVIIYVGNLLIDASKKGGGLGKMIHDGVDMAMVAVDRVISGAKLISNGFQLAFSLIDAGFHSFKGELTSFAASWVDIYGVRIPQGINDFVHATERGITSVKQKFQDTEDEIKNGFIGALNDAGATAERFAKPVIDALNKIIELSNKYAHSSIDPIPAFKYDPIPAVQPTPLPPFKFDGYTDFNTSGAEQTRDDLDQTAKEALDYADSLTGKNKELVDSTRDAWNTMTSDQGGAFIQGWRAGGDAVDDVKKKVDVLDYSLGTGMPAAVDNASKAVHKMAKEFSLVTEYGQAATKGLEKSIDDFTKTGKLNFKEFTASLLQDLAAITLKAAILGDLLGNSKFGGSGSIIGTGSNSFWGQAISGYFSGFSGVPKGIALSDSDATKYLATGSYDGGGFTGFGSRSGGVDGKGGFPAVLHPNETVVDHARGQSLGGGDTAIHQHFYIKETMTSGQVRAIQQSSISGATSAMKDINKRGGKRRDQYFGRR